MDRWQELREFVAKWNERPISDGDGNTEEEVAAAESRLRVGLPDAVREFYKLIGNREDLTARYDRLIPISDLSFYGDYLAIWEENQGVSTIGIVRNDFHESDPPTRMFFDDEEILDVRQDDRFSDSALIAVATEIINGGDYSGAWMEEWQKKVEPVPEKVLAEAGFATFDDMLVYVSDLAVLIAVSDAETMRRVADKWDHIEWTHI